MAIQVRSTLFIGLGGTGKAVLDAIRSSLVRALAPKKRVLPGCFSFLKVDLDVSRDPLRKDDLEGDVESDLLVARIPAFARIDDTIRNMPGDCYEAVSKWWPPGLGSKLATRFPGEQDADQAYQLRVVGRAAFWLNNETPDGFHNRVSSALDSVRANTMIAATDRDFPDLRVNVNHVDVWVVSSLAGGTGCGMLIDALAVLRKVLADKQIGAITTVSTFLLLPELFAGRVKELGLGVPKCNAYAALKELDNLMRNQDSGDTPDGESAAPYTETYDGHTKTSLSGRLSTFVYLIDKQNEAHYVFQDRDEVAEKISDFIFLMCTGLTGIVNQGMGRVQRVTGTQPLSRERGSPRVTTAYSSMGLRGVLYPRSLVQRYAAHYLRQSLLRLIESEGLARDSEAAVRLVNEFVEGPGTGRQAAWYKVLVPVVDAPTLGFVAAQASDYAAHKRKTLLGTISKSYREDKQKVETHFRNAEAKAVAEANLERRVAGYLDHALRRFVRDRSLGIAAAEQVVAELLGKIKVQQETHLHNATAAEGRFLKQEPFQGDTYKPIPTLFLWGSREPLVRSLLDTLQADLKARIDCHTEKIQAAVCGALHQKLVTARQGLVSALRQQITHDINAARAEARQIKEQFVDGPKNWVGCEEDTIEELKTQVKHLAEMNQSLLRERITADLKLVATDLDEVADAALAELHLERRTVLTEIARVQTDVCEYVAGLARNEAAPLWSFGGDAQEVAITHVLVSGFSSAQISEFTHGKPIPNGVQPATLAFLDDCQLWLVSIRDGAPAYALAGVRGCYDAYKASKGKVGIPGTEIWFPATILHGAGAAHWTELFREKPQGTAKGTSKPRRKS